MTPFGLICVHLAIGNTHPQLADTRPRIHSPEFSHVVALNTLRPRQNGRHFPDDIFKWIFLNKNVWISIKISLTFVPTGPISNYFINIISNIPALFQIMAWRRPGDNPLSESMIIHYWHIYASIGPNEFKCREILRELAQILNDVILSPSAVYRISVRKPQTQISSNMIWPPSLISKVTYSFRIW